MEYYSKSFDGKKIIWFKSKNQYLILENAFSNLLIKCINGLSHEDFKETCMSEYNLSPIECIQLYRKCKEIIQDQDATSNFSKRPSSFLVLNYEMSSSIVYQWNAQRVCVNYASEKLKNLVHPKFHHLTHICDVERSIGSIFHVFKEDNKIVLSVDEECFGEWGFNEFHLFQGKFSMCMLNHFTRKKDKNWLATLHASAVYKQDSCLVLLGESGKGKSIATSLLLTNGYQHLADDFVPIEADSKRIFAFPQAVSIKEAMVNPLSKYFPQLLSSICKKKDEIQFRYLHPEINQLQIQKSKKCKAFVFINYSKGSTTKFSSLTKTRALELLIPDSWISPLEKNSMAFLDLILETPCYTLEYSDNSSMLKLIDQLMNNEL